MQAASRDSASCLHLTPLWWGGVQVQFEHWRSSSEWSNAEQKKKIYLPIQPPSSKRGNTKRKECVPQRAKRAKREREMDYAKTKHWPKKYTQLFVSNGWLPQSSCVCVCRGFLVFYSRSFSFIRTFSKSLSNIIHSNFYSARFPFFTIASCLWF